MKNQYVIGVDYGTDSVRSVLIDTSNGKEISQSVFYYPRWKAGKYCVPAKNQFRQHPLDYLEGLENTIKDCLAKAPAVNPESVKGITVDTTGSTPVAVDKTGTPLALTAGFEENPNAMFVLWKDHTSVNEAAEINQVSRTWGGIDYTQFEGGIYSSEWFWAKILHITREDESIANGAYSWMEHCDWIPSVLIGSNDVDAVKRSRCAAGHKAMWHESWGGLPSEEYLGKFDSRLAALRSRLFEDTYTADVAMGNLSEAWAEKLGLSTETIVSVGTFDAHAGAVGVEIESATLVKVMGTSTCDMMVAPFDEIGDKLVRGICGQVDGSIIPGMLGLEAGQSAFGDLLAWFKNLTMWSVQNADIAPEIKQQIEDSIIVNLSKAAAAIPISEKNVVALDWVNGRRTPDANQALKGAIMGLGMGSDAPAIFRAMVEAICFGSKAIVDRFKNEGVDIKQIVGMGGVAKKSDFVMQTLADVLDMPVKIATSEQAPALGAAMYAAVAAGIYPDVNTAVSAMGNGFDKTYFPIVENVELYAKLYEKYEALGAFVESQTL
ncbi:ribulokinase [Arcicella rosea]|uniref:Ribulokinase n=1 Tax=Arcicella rosea TaxID=502909 RepID=A0A841ERI9_9BACT|nr:ribulokinase [Arcicella rosea]MBB6005556.1 L-ribulokinase [Arcicella rosea]